MPYPWVTGETITAAKLNPNIRATAASPTSINAWSTVASLSVAKAGMAGTWDASYLYIYGGFDQTNYLTTTERYDIAANSWTTRAAMTTARTGAGCGHVGTVAYVYGGAGTGFTRLSSHEAYDTSANTWSSKASMSASLFGPGSGAIGIYCYWFGGNLATNVTERYDTGTNAWVSRANMPALREYHGSCASDQHLYAAGGALSGAVNTFYQYDPLGNSWSSKATLSSQRAYIPLAFVSTPYANGIYAMGGNATNGNSVTTNEKYNISTNTWSAMTALPTGKDLNQGKAHSVGMYAYLVGGMVRSGGGVTITYQNAVNRFIPDYNDAYVSDSNRLVAAYGNVTLTNITNNNTGKVLFVKSGDKVVTDIATDLMII